MVRGMRHILLVLVATQAFAQKIPVGHGWAVRDAQVHQGLPVIGADRVTRLDEDGRVVRTRGRHVDLTGFDVTPQITAARAAEIAGAPGPVKTQLAVDPDAAGGPRLVWAVRGTPIPELMENAV